MVLPFNLKHRNSLTIAVVLFFFCVAPFPLAGQTQQELDSALHELINSIIVHNRGDITQVRTLLEVFTASMTVKLF